jgi:hypothetical protein
MQNENKTPYKWAIIHLTPDNYDHPESVDFFATENQRDIEFEKRAKSLGEYSVVINEKYMKANITAWAEPVQEIKVVTTKVDY